MSCQQVLTQREFLDARQTSSAHMDLIGTPHAVPLARLFLREQARVGLPAQSLATAELLTSELVTNALMHARTSINVGVTWDVDDNIVVAVHDANQRAPTQRELHIRDDEIVESGWGMFLVATLADDFGWYLLPGSAGKVIWFGLAVPHHAPA